MNVLKKLKDLIRSNKVDNKDDEVNEHIPDHYKRFNTGKTTTEDDSDRLKNYLTDRFEYDFSLFVYKSEAPYMVSDFGQILPLTEEEKPFNDHFDRFFNGGDRDILFKIFVFLTNYLSDYDEIITNKGGIYLFYRVLDDFYSRNSERKYKPDWLKFSTMLTTLESYHEQILDHIRDTTIDHLIRNKIVRSRDCQNEGILSEAQFNEIRHNTSLLLKSTRNTTCKSSLKHNEFKVNTDDYIRFFTSSLLDIEYLIHKSKDEVCKVSVIAVYDLSHNEDNPKFGKVKIHLFDLLFCWEYY